MTRMRSVCQNCPQYPRSRTTESVCKAEEATDIDP